MNKKQIKKFLGLSLTISTLLTIPLVSLSCKNSKDNQDNLELGNDDGIEKQDLSVAKKIVEIFKEHRFSFDEMNQKLFLQNLNIEDPKNPFKKIRFEDFYNNRVKDWNFKEKSEYNRALELDNDLKYPFFDIKNQNSFINLLKNDPDPNLYRVFNKYFQIRLRTNDELLKILFVFELVSKKMQQQLSNEIKKDASDLNVKNYFNLKTYAINHFLLDYTEFLESEEPETTMHYTFRLLSYIVPPVAISSIIIYIIIMVLKKRHKSKTRA